MCMGGGTVTAPSITAAGPRKNANAVLAERRPCSSLSLQGDRRNRCGDVTAYTASKTAIAGFTGSLAFEHDAFGIHVELVEPGYGPITNFTSNGDERMSGLIPEAQVLVAARVVASCAQPSAVMVESDVVETFWRVANDVTGQLRFPAGADAVVLARTR